MSSARLAACILRWAEGHMPTARVTWGDVAELARRVLDGDERGRLPGEAGYDPSPPPVI